MTPQQAGVSAGLLSEIIARAKTKTPCATNYQCLLADLMELLRADEQLCRNCQSGKHAGRHGSHSETCTCWCNALLATAPPERAAPTWAERHGLTVDKPMQPQAASGGAVSAEQVKEALGQHCDAMLKSGDPSYQDLADRLNAMLAAHDQKVRETAECHPAKCRDEMLWREEIQKVRREVLEEAAEQFTQGWIRIKIRALASGAEEKK